MSIDWSLVATIAAPLIALLAGAALDRFFGRRPKLIAYLSHVSAFQLRDPAQTQLYTHSVVVRNAGRRPASNVRLRHNHLPEHFNVYPSVPYEVEQLPEGGSDILIPSLVPNQQVMIQYLYTPPITWNQVNGPIQHDGGYAKIVDVLLQRQYGRWVRFLIGTLMLLGLIAALYLLGLVVRWSVGSLWPIIGA